MTSPLDHSMQRPKIAFVVSHPIQHFCPMYRSLARKSSWDILVLFASSAGMRRQWDPNFSLEIEWEGLTMDFPHHFLNDEAVLPIGPRLDAPDLETMLDNYDPNVLVLYGYAQRLQRRAMRWGKSKRRAMLMISDSEARHPQSIFKRALKHIVLPVIYRQMSGYLTVGDANEDYYRSYGVEANKLHRAPFPIDSEMFEPFYQNRRYYQKQCRRDLGIPEDCFVCTMVGKLVPWKRQIDLIMALRHLEDCDSEITTLIVGTGKDEATLRQEAITLKRHRVVFTGFVQPNRLPALYGATNEYVHTASFEPHSLAISEAIYMGCPVILSDRCGSFGPTDDVQPGRNGLVYPCMNTKALADRIRQLVSSEKTADSFGRASRSIATASQDLAHGGGLAAALKSLNVL